MISELKHIADFPFNAVGSTDLIVYDVDQVILDPLDGALSARGETIKAAQLREWTARLGVARTNYLYSIWVQARQVRLVEDDFLACFETHRQAGIEQMVLSAFPTGAFGVIQNATDYRRRQLESLGLDFTTSINAYPNGLLYADSWPEQMPGRRPRYESGLLLTGQGGVGTWPITKGEVFAAFIDHTAMKSRKVWFIDDGLGHVHSMQSMCEQRGLAFQGFVYRHAYQGLAIDEALARYQFAYLENHQVWLDDTQARQLVSASGLD